MQRIFPVQQSGAIDTALELLRSGNIVAIPTETVYGLAADATNEYAVQKVFAAKKRPADNPLICHVSDVQMAETYANLPMEFYTLAEAFWPGPLTMFVREGQGIAVSVRANTGKVSFRMPAQEEVLELIRRLGRPLAAPSANISGKPSATMAVHVERDFSAEDVSCILDGGQSAVGLESTIIDLTPLEEGEAAIVVREGAVSLSQLAAYVPVRYVQQLEQGMTVSPGLKHKHYAPTGTLMLFEGTPEDMSTDMQNYIEDGTVIIASSQQVPFLQEAGVPVLDGGASTEEAATRFYDLLRQCDILGATRILCTTWPEKEGIGEALRQRQKKAAGLI